MVYESELLQSNNLKPFLELYAKKYSMFKPNFVSNAYARDVMNVPSEKLRARNREKEIIELLSYLTLEFGILIKEKLRKKELKKIGRDTYKYIL